MKKTKLTLCASTTVPANTKNYIKYS